MPGFLLVGGGHFLPIIRDTPCGWRAADVLRHISPMPKGKSEIQRRTSPVLIASIEKRIYVIRGQKVMLTLNDHEMTIKTTATALEDGRVGDSISVENQESQKTVRATVGRDGGVEINF